MSALWRRYVAFWSEREGPETLALVRITFGVCLIANVLEQLFNGDALELYANVSFGGVFPYLERSAYSLFRYLAPTDGVVYALLGAQLVAAVLLTAGLFSRPAAIVCLVIQMSLYDRIPLFRFDADNVFRVFLYLMALAPVSAVWSLDARWRGLGKVDVPAWGRRLLVAQLTFLYVRTGIIKLGSTWSLADGYSALYYSANLPGLARWPGDWAASIYPLTQVATFTAKWWEITFFLIPLNLYLARRQGEGGRLRRLLASPGLRYLLVMIGIGLHASLVVLMNLGMFPFVMVSLYPALLTPQEVRRALGARVRRLARAA